MHPDNVGEIKNVLRSHGFYAKEIARLGKPDGGTIVDNEQVVLGVPCDVAKEAKAVLSSYFKERGKAIKGDSDTLKRSVFVGLGMGQLQHLPYGS